MWEMHRIMSSKNWYTQYLKEVVCDMEEEDFQNRIKAVGLRLHKRKRFLEQQDK